MKLFLSLVLLTITAHAGEYIVLSTGFRIHADSHIADGDVMRIQTNQGAIEIPANMVAAIETEEYTPPPPPSAIPQPPAPAADSEKDLTPRELVTRAAIRN